jgi:hypothetical protein
VRLPQPPLLLHAVLKMRHFGNVAKLHHPLKEERGNLLNTN